MIYVKYYSTLVAGNTSKTLKKKIVLNQVLSKLEDNSFLQLKNLSHEYKELNFWDLGKKASTIISNNDILVLICKNDIFSAKVETLIDDYEGVLGDIFGWSRQFKKPWQNVIVLKDLKMKLKVTNTTLIDFAKKYGVSIAQNFYEIPESAKRDFSSLLKSYLLSIDTDSKMQSGGISEPIQVASVPKWIQSIRNEITELRQDASHQERGHESLVERFYEGLGYERVSEIKYRLGHVDILIQLDSKPFVVTEVKKTWKLSRKDTKVVHQAYRYALENGARYIVITNGDYYAIFDRIKGFTIESNFIGEYYISKSDEDVSALMKFLSRANLEESFDLKNILKEVMDNI